MEALLDHLLEIAQTIVWPIVAGSVLVAGFALLDHAKYQFHSWRLRRRLARDPYILRDELREYQFDIGGKPAAIEWTSLSRIPRAWILAVAAGVVLQFASEQLLASGFGYFAAGMLVPAGLVIWQGIWTLMRDPAALEESLVLEAEAREAAEAIDIAAAVEKRRRYAVLQILGGMGLVAALLIFAR